MAHQTYLWICGAAILFLGSCAALQPTAESSEPPLHLYLLAGQSNIEIAAAHHVSVNTVKTHLRTAYRKLGVSSRKQLRILFDLDGRRLSE